MGRGDTRLVATTPAVDEMRARRHRFLACALSDLAHTALLDGNPIVARAAAREAVNVG